MKNLKITDQYGRELPIVASEKEATEQGLKNYALVTTKGVVTRGTVIIVDRAGYRYALVENQDEAIKKGLTSYVTYTEDNKPLVIREGKPVMSSFFYLEEEGAKKKRWAKLLNSADPKKVDKALSSKETPVIVRKNGEMVCQFISLINIVWHDATGRTFFLIDKWDAPELEADHLCYVSGESEGTYETLRYFAFDGEKRIPVPASLANEKGRSFKNCTNFKREAYKALRKQKKLTIAMKNKMVLARRADTNEYILAHTYSAGENGRTLQGNDLWVLEYLDGEGGTWTNTTKEFFERYEFYSTGEGDRAIFAPKGAQKYAWVQLEGDFIGCIPQWGDSMVSMTNPMVNISNPEDVYCCSYIIFFGKEDNSGAYAVIKHVSLGQDEVVVLEFAKALAGFVETEFGIPKQMISASNLNRFLIENLCVPSEDEVLEAKVVEALA